MRELEKVLKRAVDLAGARRIRIEHIPPSIREALTNGPLIEVPERRRRAAPTQDQLKALLVEHDGNVAAVARKLDRRERPLRLGGAPVPRRRSLIRVS